MKARKILGNISTCLGGILLFGGLLAWFLPRWDNQQVQLVINSFHTPSGNPILQWMNNGMTFAMERSSTVMVLGAVLMIIGILLSSSVRTETAAQAAPAARQPVYAAPVAAAAGSVAAAPQVNPFARVQSAEKAEDNPFAKYLAPDTVPKSTAARSEETLPAAAEELPPAEPALLPDAEDDTKVYRLTPAEPEPEEEQILYALVDDEYDEDDEDDEDDLAAFESDADTAPVDAGGAVYYPLQTAENETGFAYRFDDDEEPVFDAAEAEDAAEETADDGIAEEAEATAEPVAETAGTETLWQEAYPEEAASDDAFIPVETAEEEETAVEEMPVAEEETTAEDAMPAAEENLSAAQDAVSATAQPDPQPDPQPAPALRPVIRSTFKKSTASQSAGAASRNAVSESAGLKPASRIKSTMGQKR